MKKALFAPFILFAVLFAWPALVLAADSIKYISPAGTGDGNSIGSPDTLEDAYNALRTTDGNHAIYFVEAGTYTLGASLPLWNNAGDSLTMAAYGDLTAEDVIIDGVTLYSGIDFNNAGQPLIDLVLTNLTFYRMADTSDRTAVLLNNCRNATIAGCVFDTNINDDPDDEDCHGAAIYAATNVSGTITITTSKFLNNTASDGVDSGVGGAIRIRDFGGIVTLTYNDFTGNLAYVTGGAVRIESQAAHVIGGNTWTSNTTTAGQGSCLMLINDGVSATITGDKYYSNSGVAAASAGGAIKFSAGADGDVDDCFFYQNVSGEGGAIDFGGSVGTGSSTLTNSIFIGNNADDSGGQSGDGGAWQNLAAHTVTASNNTYWGNTADGNGQDLDLAGTVTLKNEIHQYNATWNDSNVTVVINAAGAGTIDIQYCDIEGGADAVTNEDVYTNNLNANPIFVNATEGTASGLSLGESSPCIDAGTPQTEFDADFFGNIRPKGNEWDIGFHEFGRSDFWTAGAPSGGCEDCLDAIYSAGGHTISLGDVAFLLYGGEVYRCILKNSGTAESVPTVIDPDNAGAGAGWRWHCAGLE